MLHVAPDAGVDRRKFLVCAAAALSATRAFGGARATAAEPDAKPQATEQQIRNYLRPLLLTREDVDLWLKRQAFPFAKYDSELGYLHTDREFREGLDGAVCRYRYDKHDARQMLASAGEPCRINTYGDSARAIAQFIKTEVRPDQAFVEYLNEQKRPCVDLLQAHAVDLARFKGTPEEALSRYFVGRSGHYSPLGNHWCAFAMKDALVRLLDPRPPAFGP